MPVLLSECRLDRLSPGVYERVVSREWWAQGALHGGFVLALAMTAVQAELGDSGRSLHQVSLQYLRPFVDGPCRIEVEVERSGRRMANASLRLWSAGRLTGVGLAAVASRQPAGEVGLVSAPVVAPYDETANSHDKPARAIQEKAWIQTRSIEGDDAAPSRVLAWVAPRTPEPIDHRWIAVVVDMLVPAVYRAWEVPRTSQTVDLTYHARAALPGEGLPPGSPILVALTNRIAAGGFVDEDVEVWTDRGVLLAQSRQMRLISDPPTSS